MVMHCTECSDVKAFPLKVVGNDFGATLHKSGHTVMLGYPKDHCVSTTSCVRIASTQPIGLKR